MSLSRMQSVTTFSSASGRYTYYFDVAVDTQGLVQVRNIRSPNGPIDALNGIPSSVMDDMEDAKEIVVQMLASGEAYNGTVTFTGETYQDVAFPADLNNTLYRVAYVTPDGLILTTVNKTISGFRAETPAAYGTVLAPKIVGWVALVSTYQSGSTGGTITFTSGGGETQTVTFPVPFQTDAFRVLLEPDGFYAIKVLSQTRAGFTAQLGYTLATGFTATVGYDVFL